MVFPQKKEMFTKKYFKYIGSVGKKPVSGDIDFAIDVSTIVDKSFSDKSIQKWGLNPEEVHKQFESFKKRAKTATDAEIMVRAILKGIVGKINGYAQNIYCDEKKITAGNIFGFFPQFTPTGEKLDYGVQMDWLISDMELLEFSYYSDVYEGNVKGLHRTQLMLSAFNYYGYSFNHTKGLYNKETKELLAKKPKDIVPYLEEAMGMKLSKNTMNNYFKLIDKINTLSKKDRDGILHIYFKILSHTRADIPQDLHEDWKRLNRSYHYETKFLPSNSRLLENLSFADFIRNL